MGRSNLRIRRRSCQGYPTGPDRSMLRYRCQSLFDVLAHVTQQTQHGRRDVLGG